MTALQLAQKLIEEVEIAGGDYPVMVEKHEIVSVSMQYHSELVSAGEEVSTTIFRLIRGGV